MNNSTAGNITSCLSSGSAAVLAMTSIRLLLATTIFVLAYIPTLAAISKVPWNSAIKWMSLNLFAANTVQILGNMLTLAVDIYVVQTKKDAQVLGNVIFSLQVLYIVGYLNLVFMLSCVHLWRVYYPNVKHKWIAHLLATVMSWISALAFSLAFVSTSVRMSNGSPCVGHLCPSIIPGLDVIRAVGDSVTTFAPTMATYLLYLTFLKLVSTATSNYEDWKMVKQMSLIITLLQVKLAADQISLLVISSNVSPEAYWAGSFCSEFFLLLFVVLSAFMVVSYEPYRTKAKKVYVIDRCLSKCNRSAVHPLHDCQETQS